MKVGENLIDNAAKVCGSVYKLSKITGVSQGSLSDMAHGGRAISPGLAAQLAAIVGEDPRTAALLEIVAKEKRADRRAKLAALFGLPFDISGRINTTSSKV
jgi:plasmid maintenance system antidote protein VapI